MASITSVLQKTAENAIVAKFVAGLNGLFRKLGPWHMKMEGQHVTFATLDRLVVILLHKFSPAEAFEVELWQSNCGKGDRVVDVGANLGLYAFLAADQVGDSGSVVAVEACPSNFAMLEDSLSLNGYSNVKLVHAAVCDKSGPVSFFVKHEHTGDGQLANNSTGRECVQVQGLTLDELLNDDKPVDLIKFDIQGAEAFAIKGIQKVLDRSPNIKIISEFWPKGLTRCGMDPKDYLSWWREQGFGIWIIDENNKTLAENKEDQAILDLALKHRYLNLLLKRA